MRRKTPQMTAQPIPSPVVPTNVEAAPKLTMDDLTEDEQQVALMDPEQATKMVALPWMNKAHCEELVRSNMLSDNLAVGIRAFQNVKAKNLEQGIHE